MILILEVMENGPFPLFKHVTAARKFTINFIDPCSIITDSGLLRKVGPLWRLQLIRLAVFAMGPLVSPHFMNMTFCRDKYCDGRSVAKSLGFRYMNYMNYYAKCVGLRHTAHFV